MRWSHSAEADDIDWSLAIRIGAAGSAVHAEAMPNLRHVAVDEKDVNGIGSHVDDYAGRLGSGPGYAGRLQVDRDGLESCRPRRCGDAIDKCAVPRHGVDPALVFLCGHVHPLSRHAFGVERQLTSHGSAHVLLTGRPRESQDAEGGDSIACRDQGVRPLDLGPSYELAQRTSDGIYIKDPAVNERAGRRSAGA